MHTQVYWLVTLFNGHNDLLTYFQHLRNFEVMNTFIIGCVVLS